MRLQELKMNDLIYEYREPSLDELLLRWDKNISNNCGDTRWTDWKAEYIRYNINGKAKTFVVFCGNEPVGEGTILLSPECAAVNGRKLISDGKKTANINALRIEKEYEGKGHISRLVHEIEQYAVKKGYSTLKIGVEAKETRNLAIYLHWGYNKYITSEIEEGESVLYFSKQIN